VIPRQFVHQLGPALWEVAADNVDYRADGEPFSAWNTASDHPARQPLIADQKAYGRIDVTS
jgi:hypothetical protein